MNEIREVMEGKGSLSDKTINLYMNLLARIIGDIKDLKQTDEVIERINQANSFVNGLMSEWRWIERRRTKLDERRQFLEKAIADLKERIKTAKKDPEVIAILQGSLDEFEKLLAQIDRILLTSTSEPNGDLLDPEDALAAIQSMLKILPKRFTDLEALEDTKEWTSEKERIFKALQQALETAQKHKFKETIPQIEEALEKLNSLVRTS